MEARGQSGGSVPNFVAEAGSPAIRGCIRPTTCCVSFWGFSIVASHLAMCAPGSTQLYLTLHGFWESELWSLYMSANTIPTKAVSPAQEPSFLLDVASFALSLTNEISKFFFTVRKLITLICPYILILSVSPLATHTHRTHIFIYMHICIFPTLSCLTFF